MVPNGIKRVQIDSTLQLADINKLNNTKPFPIKYYFDSKIANTPDWANYEAFVGPSVWYDTYDGLQLGAHVHGDYMLFRDNLNATVYYNTHVLTNLPANTPNSNGNQVAAFKVDFQTPTDSFITNSSINLYAQSLDGLEEGKILYQVKDNSLKNTFYAQLKADVPPFC